MVFDIISLSLEAPGFARGSRHVATFAHGRQGPSGSTAIPMPISGIDFEPENPERASEKLATASFCPLSPAIDWMDREGITAGERVG